MSTKNQTLTVTGIVTPVDWDDNGNVTEIEISANMEQDYVVVMNGKGRKLLKLCSKTVEAKGIISEDKNGDKTITILNFDVVHAGRTTTVN